MTIKRLRESIVPFYGDHVPVCNRLQKVIVELKYEQVAKVARIMSEGEAVVLIVLNGKEGSGYAVHADSGLGELLPPILRRVAKLIEPERQ
jgi:hypothetical protein